MFLLNRKGWLLLLLAIALCGGLNAPALLNTPQLALAQSEDAQDAEQPPADDTEDDDETEEVWPGGARDPNEPDLPEGVRRRRPQTDDEERRYKLQRVRTDPFLNAPASSAPLPYNPMDWVSKKLQLDRSVYLIQDAKGALQGRLTISSDRQTNAAGDYIRVLKERSEPFERVEMSLFAETLRPRRITISHPARLIGGEPEEQQLQRTVVDYLFDRITIQRSVGAIQTGERMRELPFSFDIEQLPLLVRLLKFAQLEQEQRWPFEAFITEPRQKRTLQLQIERPRRVSIMSAEPADYQAFELTMRLDDQTWTWWVERLAPHRLVRFSDGALTYSLHDYTPVNSY